MCLRGRPLRMGWPTCLRLARTAESVTSGGVRRQLSRCCVCRPVTMSMLQAMICHPLDATVVACWLLESASSHVHIGSVPASVEICEHSYRCGGASCAGEVMCTLSGKSEAWQLVNSDICTLMTATHRRPKPIVTRLSCILCRVSSMASAQLPASGARSKARCSSTARC